MAKHDLTVIGTNLHTSLSVLASQLAQMEGEAMVTAINEVTKAKEDWEGGPFLVYFAMVKNYGDKLGDFPDPSVETGEKPARWKTKVPGTNGKEVSKTVDFYILFSDATKAGTALIQERQWLKRLADDNDAHKGIPADFIEKYSVNAMVRAERDAWIGRRLNTMRNAYRKAMSLAYQLEKVNGLEGIIAKPLYTDKTETAVRNTPEPIMLMQEPTEEQDITQIKWRHMSISSFLRLNAAKASESDTPYDALIASLKRDKKKGEGATNDNDTASRPQHIATTDTFHARMADVLEYLDQAYTSKDTARLGEITKALNGPGSDDLFLAVWQVKEMLVDLTKGDKARARAEKLDEAAHKEAA